MNRLSTRFSLTMIGVSAVTLLILIALQLLIARPQLETFGQDLGVSIDALLGSPLRSGADATEVQLETLQAQLTTLERGLEDAFADQSAYREAQRRSFWLSSAFTLLLAVGFGWFAGQRLARPVDRIADTAKRVAAGDLSARVSLRSSNREVSDLARTFDLMTENLQRLEEERKATLNDIAHDLRTPLTSVQWRLEAFEDGVRPVTLENVLGLQHAVDTMSRLVKDLRTLALAEGGYLQLSRERVDVAKLARDIVAEFEDRARQRRVSLALHAAVTAHADADPARLSQIIYNLLDNALKYTPQGGRIALFVLEAGGEVQLIVRDSGEGLGEEDIKRVMNRFYRVDAAKEAPSELGASGLGLAIVNALTLLHGGRLEIANAQEGGAEFRVALPSALVASVRDSGSVAVSA